MILLYNNEQQLRFLVDSLYNDEIKKEDAKKILIEIARADLDLEMLCFTKTWRKENGNR